MSNDWQINPRVFSPTGSLINNINHFDRKSIFPKEFQYHHGILEMTLIYITICIYANAILMLYAGMSARGREGGSNYPPPRIWKISKPYLDQGGPETPKSGSAQ